MWDGTGLGPCRGWSKDDDQAFVPGAGHLAVYLGDLASLFQSSQDPCSSSDSEIPSSQETSVAFRVACPQDANQSDPCDRSWLGGASSRVISLPPAKRQHQESLGPQRSYSAPLLATSDSSDPELSAELDDRRTREAQAQGSILARQSKVTWESGVSSINGHCPEKLRPGVGWDWPGTLQRLEQGGGPGLCALMGSLPSRVRGSQETL